MPRKPMRFCPVNRHPRRTVALSQSTMQRKLVARSAPDLRFVAIARDCRDIPAAALKDCSKKPKVARAHTLQSLGFRAIFEANGTECF